MTEIKKLEKNAFVVKCFCGQEIVGWSRSHADYNLKVHIAQKHPKASSTQSETPQMGFEIPESQRNLPETDTEELRKEYEATHSIGDYK